MSPGYGRSVLLRIAGALASIALWLAVIVFALDNLDTGLPTSEGLNQGWPFLIAGIAIVVVVALWLRHAAPGPGWGSFLLGLLIPELAFAINRLVSTEIGTVFWIAAAVMTVVPLPKRKAVAAVA
jgi:hypothetical protein